MTDHVVQSGLGTASAVPDTARLELAVEAVASDVGAALARCSSASAAVLDALSGHQVGTSSVSLSEHWGGSSNRRDGYAATQSLTVRLADTGRVGEVVEACAAAAGDLLRIHQLSWAFSPDLSESLDRAAREAAWGNALARAEQVAALAGRDLGPVLEITEVAGGADVLPPGVHRAVAAMESKELPTVAGQDEVSVALTVRWALV